MVNGATPSTWNCGLTGTRWIEIADFEPIFARSASAVTTSEKKFKINTNRKFITAFHAARQKSKVGRTDASLLTHLCVNKIRHTRLWSAQPRNNIARCPTPVVTSIPILNFQNSCYRLAVICVNVSVVWSFDRANDRRHQFADLHTLDKLPAECCHLDQLLRVAESRHEGLHESPQTTFEIHPLPAAAMLHHRHLVPDPGHFSTRLWIAQYECGQIQLLAVKGHALLHSMAYPERIRSPWKSRHLISVLDWTCIRWALYKHSVLLYIKFWVYLDFCLKVVLKLVHVYAYSGQIKCGFSRFLHSWYKEMNEQIDGIDAMLNAVFRR